MNVYRRGVKISARRGSRSRRSLIIVTAVLLETVALRLRGYRMGGNVVVRCRNGHFFTTIWVPLRVPEVGSVGLVEILVLPGRQALVARDPGQGTPT